jgi:hypothetical protein
MVGGEQWRELIIGRPDKKFEKLYKYTIWS